MNTAINMPGLTVRAGQAVSLDRFAARAFADQQRGEGERADGGGTRNARDRKIGETCAGGKHGWAAGKGVQSKNAAEAVIAARGKEHAVMHGPRCGGWPPKDRRRLVIPIHQQRRSELARQNSQKAAAVASAQLEGPLSIDGQQYICRWSDPDEVVYGCQKVGTALGFDVGAVVELAGDGIPVVLVGCLRHGVCIGRIKISNKRRLNSCVDR